MSETLGEALRRTGHPSQTVRAGTVAQLIVMMGKLHA